VHLAAPGTEERHELADLLRRHVRHTGSPAARDRLASWPRAVDAFRLVVPKAPKAVPSVNENETPAISTGNRNSL
jgi:glutamate synthase domain-containing protein 3